MLYCIYENLRSGSPLEKILGAPLGLQMPPPPPPSSSTSPSPRRSAICTTEVCGLVCGGGGWWGGGSGRVFGCHEVRSGPQLGWEGIESGTLYDTWAGYHAVNASRDTHHRETGKIAPHYARLLS